MTPAGTSEFDGLMADAMVQLNGTFGESVTYCPRNGRSFAVTAIFDESHTVIDNSGEVPFETVKPVLSIPTADLRSAGFSNPSAGDSVVIRGVKYGVAEVMPDGRAEVRLVLAKGATRA